jgi:energy-coupling factor transport system ATP-binding protein
VLIFEHRRDIVRPAVDREVAMAGGCVRAAPAAAAGFPAVRPGPMGEERLVFDGVAAAWPGRERPLFADARFSVRSGESVALLGENGSGKTTLLSMAMGLLKPASGVIQHRGRPVGRTSPKELARRAAFLFQHPDHQLYLARVGDEVRMQTRDREAADAELAALGLRGLEDRHPRSLSMGQKRRLTIAAALARRPRLLLMDEPSVGQDDDSLGRILRRLDRFVREGGALLTATHDVRVARALAHRTLILANGRLSAGDREAAKTFFDNGPGPKAANPIQPAHEAPIHRPDSDIQRVFNRHEGR